MLRNCTQTQPHGGCIDRGFKGWDKQVIAVSAASAMPKRAGIGQKPVVLDDTLQSKVPASLPCIIARSTGATATFWKAKFRVPCGGPTPFLPFLALVDLPPLSFPGGILAR